MSEDTTRDSRRTGARFLLVAASLVIVVAGLKQAQTIVVPFLLSLFLAMIAIPPMLWLKSKKVPTPLALLCVVLGILLVLGLMGALVGNSINQVTGQFDRYQERFKLPEDMEAWAQENLPGWLVPYASDVVAETRNVIAKANLGTMAFRLVQGLFSGITSAVSYSFLVLLSIVFMLAEAAGFREKLKASMASFGDRGTDLERFGQILTQVRQYLVIKTLVSLATGMLVGVWVWAWGVDFPFLWGVVAFLLNYIPNLGSIIAAIPPVLLSLVQPDGGLSLAVAVAIGYLAVNMVMGNLVEPRLMGQRLGLSTLVVFLSLVFWGWVWGTVGMVLSVPLTMIVKIGLQNSDDLRWVAILLDSKAPQPVSELSEAPAPEPIQEEASPQEDSAEQDAKGDSAHGTQPIA